MKPHGDSDGASARNGTEATSVTTMTRARAEAIRQRSAEEAADAARQQVEEDGRAGLVDREPATRQQDWRERHEAVRGRRAQHDREVEQRQRHRGGPQRCPARALVGLGPRHRRHLPQRPRQARAPGQHDERRPVQSHARDDRHEHQRRRARSRATRPRCAPTSPGPCGDPRGDRPAPPPAGGTPRRQVRRAPESLRASAATWTGRSKLRIGTATSRPARGSSARGCQRSASAPKPSCDTEFDIWNAIASVPAVASDRFRWGISSGSSGAYMFV